MPTVERKYKPDPREGRQNYQGNHDVYEMPEQHKPRGIGRVHINPRAIMTILLLLLFIVATSIVILEIMKRSQTFV